MAHDEEHDREDRATGPTYKSLFLAAVALIGSTFGWWITNFISYVDSINARGSIMEIRHKEFEWTFKINTEKINSHDERLKELERYVERHREREDRRRGEP